MLCKDITQKIFRSYKKSYRAKNTYERLCDGLLFNEITRNESRRATVAKKMTPPRRFTCEYIRIFNTSTGRSYMSSAFLIKLGIVYFRAATADPGPP